MKNYTVGFVRLEMDWTTSKYGVIDSTNVDVVARDRDDAREQAFRQLGRPMGYQWTYTDEKGELEWRS